MYCWCSALTVCQSRANSSATSFDRRLPAASPHIVSKALGAERIIRQIMPQLPRSARRERTLPHFLISHSSKDDLAAEAMRIHLVERGWNHKEIFLDFSVEGISAHEQWKASLAEANSGANALLCLASPDWLASKESGHPRRAHPPQPHKPPIEQVIVQLFH